MPETLPTIEAIEYGRRVLLAEVERHEKFVMEALQRDDGGLQVVDIDGGNTSSGHGATVRRTAPGPLRGGATVTPPESASTLQRYDGTVGIG